MGEELANKLARRAENVFAKHPFWACKATPRAGFQNREFILKFMRHWLAGVLAKKSPALFCDLPEGFKIGHPLAEKPLVKEHPTQALSPKRRGRSVRPRFVQGCDLLMV